jgi:uncharacterized protein YutE (UPF0331/DUF86 family)
MNEERLLKIIEDMTEANKNIKDCKQVLENTQKNSITVFIEFGLKQIFVDYFITVENLASIILKDLKKFKIGIDMKSALDILKDDGIIDEKIYLFLNEARLLRNRISHRYKEPSTQELVEFIESNIDSFDNTIILAKKILNHEHM